MNWFTRHPNEIGLSYWEHAAKALGFAAWMLLGAILLAIHAVFPFFFKTRASWIVNKLYLALPLSPGYRGAPRR